LSKPAAPLLPQAFDFKQPFVLGGAAFIVLLLALIVFLLVRRGPKVSMNEATMAAAIAAGDSAKASLESGLSSEQKMEQQIADNQAQQAQIDAEALRGIKLPPSSRKTEVLVKHIRESVHKDSGNATNVLRTWIAEADVRKTS